MPKICNKKVPSKGVCMDARQNNWVFRGRKDKNRRGGGGGGGDIAHTICKLGSEMCGRRCGQYFVF